MNCETCNQPMKAGKENYRYTECGLDTVTLINVNVWRCAACGNYEVAIPAMERLHRFIARSLATKNDRLTGREFRFIRKAIGHSGEDIASFLGATPSQIAAWEDGTRAIPLETELKLRRELLSEGPVNNYPRKMPKVKSSTARPMSLDLRVKGAGWDTAAA